MSITRSFVTGKGTERYMNGSNVTDILSHTSQLTVDLNWPWKRSTMTDLQGDQKVNKSVTCLLE